MNTIKFIEELEVLGTDDKAIISAIKYVNSPKFRNKRKETMIDIIDELDAIKQSIKEQELRQQGEFSQSYYENVMCH